MAHTVISLFSGCGGSSLGYQLAGFKELLAIDWYKPAVDSFRLNFKDVPCWEMDIKKVTAKEILTFCNINKGGLDILDGSPPCQGFSIAGKRDTFDKRNDLFQEYMRLINGLQPKVFVMENVKGMVLGDMKRRFKEIITLLKQLNYKVKCKLLNSKYYNVPQSRERLFFIGVRKDLGLTPVFPIPSNKQIPLFKVLQKDIKHKYLSDLEVQKIVLHHKNSSKKGPKWGLKYNPLDKPFRTVIKTIGSDFLIKQGNKYRYPTLIELKRICSFPDNFQLSGSFKSCWGQLGNAVMPKQMEAIALTLKKRILD